MNNYNKKYYNDIINSYKDYINISFTLLLVS